jgi:hypothetical protein
MRSSNSVLRYPGVSIVIVLTVALLAAAGTAADKAPTRLLLDLRGSFDLSQARSPQVQYFRMETRFIHIGFDGKRTGSETYVLRLKCVPAALSGKGGDEYTCREFLVRFNEAPPVTLPTLKGWTHVFQGSGTWTDEKGQVFGIPHARFVDLADSRGNKLPVSIGYAVYNNFIDFHTFNDIFARPTPAGKGIQDLLTIGQRIVHAAAFSEPPVNLGSGIKEGSVFRNGEVTLELKGAGIVEGAACAIVGYDSGESTLRMIMPLGAGQDMETVGGSEYKGDIYVDLASRWVRKVTMDEFVLTETRLPARGPAAAGAGPGAGQGQKIQAYTVRHVLMRMISKEEYEGDQPAGK